MFPENEKDNTVLPLNCVVSKSVICKCVHRSHGYKTALRSVSCFIYRILLFLQHKPIFVLSSLRFSDWWSSSSSHEVSKNWAWLTACMTLLLPKTYSPFPLLTLSPLCATLLGLHTLTGIAQTSLPTARTETLEGVDAVDACASVLTGRWRTVVYICRRNDKPITSLFWSQSFDFQDASAA